MKGGGRDPSLPYAILRRVSDRIREDVRAVSDGRREGIYIILAAVGRKPRVVKVVGIHRLLATRFPSY